MMKTLIRCIDCNEVINMTEEDFTPIYTWHEGELQEHEANDREIFDSVHKDHKTEHLTPLTTPLSDKPYREPVKTSYFEATNGIKNFLIKRWRSSIDEAVMYEIMDGRLELTRGSVRAQTEAIKKQLKADYGSPTPMTDEKVECFLTAIHKEIEKLDPADLVLSVEGETPLIAYHLLSNNCVERILIRCQEKFNHDELQMLREFIREHNVYDDVMTVMLHTDFTVIYPAKAVREQTTRHTQQRLSVPNP
jgi:hypothetical protein